LANFLRYDIVSMLSLPQSNNSRVWMAYWLLILTFEVVFSHNQLLLAYKMHVFNLLKQFPCHIVILIRYAAILDAASSFRKKIQQKNMYKLMTLKKKKKDVDICKS